jgi:hypothetical protein
MSSFGKVKSSAKELAFIDENAYIFPVKTDVNRPIPTLASNLNRVCGKDLDIFHTRVPAEVPAKYYPGSF